VPFIYHYWPDGAKPFFKPAMSIVFVAAAEFAVRLKPGKFDCIYRNYS
jgi:hypothetical protein